MIFRTTGMLSRNLRLQQPLTAACQQLWLDNKFLNIFNSVVISWRRKLSKFTPRQESCNSNSATSQSRSALAAMSESVLNLQNENNSLHRNKS